MKKRFEKNEENAINSSITNISYKQIKSVGGSETTSKTCSLPYAGDFVCLAYIAKQGDTAPNITCTVTDGSSKLICKSGGHVVGGYIFPIAVFAIHANSPTSFKIKTSESSSIAYLVYETTTD